MCTLSEWFYSDNISHELQRKGDIECYDKVIGQLPNYPKIWLYYVVLIFKQKKDYRMFQQKKLYFN